MLRLQMETEFEAFAASLQADERDVLLASIPMLIAMVAGADETFQEGELLAAVDALLESEGTLGEQFRHSAAAEQEFETLARHVRHEVDRNDYPRLVTLRGVVRKMPANLAARYRRFVGKVVVNIAAADGSFFWFGNPISEEEAIMIRRIVAALDVPIPEYARALIHNAIDSGS
jgi:hypothetical protein